MCDMLSLTIFVLMISAVTCQKKFGPFYIKLENLDHPAPKNDVVDYYFKLKKATREKSTVIGKLEFFRKVEDLQVTLETKRKNKDSNVDDYTVCYPRQAPKSFCTPEGFYPILKQSFDPPLNEDCSVEQGIYKIVDYDVEKEIKTAVGNQSYYGGFKTRLFLIEGTTNETIVEFDVIYKHLPIVTRKKS